MISPHAHIYGSLKTGKKCRIDDGVIITGDVVLGDYVHIGPYCVLHGKSGIEIGDYSGMSSFVAIYSQSDDFSGRSLVGPCVPDSARPYLRKGLVKIGGHCIIGSHCTILPVTIGENTGVGAHSFVKNDLTGGFIYAGVPARVVGVRYNWQFHEAIG